MNWIARPFRIDSLGPVVPATAKSRTRRASSLACAAAAFLVLGGLVVPLRGQGSAPGITVVQPGADSLYADLDYVMSLTNDEEKKQLDVVKEYLDVFLIGLDRKKPLRVDLVLTGDVRRYISSFPLTDFKVFRDKNLNTLGVTVRPRGQDFWQCNGAFVGFMRKVDDYVVFAEDRNEIPRQMTPPIKGAQTLLDLKQDLTAELVNPPEGQDARRKRVQKERDEIVGALKQTKEETPDDFALRKKFFEFQFAEMERFYAESKRLLLNWNLDTKQSAKHGEFQLELVPLPDTSLAAIVKQIGEKPSRFSGISRNDKSILSLRLTHPLDELRIANFSALFEMLGKVAKQDVDADKELSAEQKTAAKSIADMTAGIFIATTKGGLADGFLEAHSNASGKNTLVGAFQAVDAAKALDILKLVPQARAEQKVEMDIATEGDVKIHKATIAGKRYDVYKDFFGSNEVFVGTSKDIVWFATGENALGDLKAAIQKGSQPAASGQGAPFFDFFAKMGPWIDLRDKRDPQAGDVKLRKMAVEAFKPGEDTFSMHLTRKNEQINGGLSAQPGILRFAGKIIADFSKENLEGNGGQKKDQNKTAKKAKKTTATE